MGSGLISRMAARDGGRLVPNFNRSAYYSRSGLDTTHLMASYSGHVLDTISVAIPPDMDERPSGEE